MEHLEDKDTFLVKLPNKLKEYLKDPFTFFLGMDEDKIGLMTSKEDAQKGA